MTESLAEEKKRLDAELDTALHTFAEYEEGMNVRWQTADPAARQALMEERNQVEEQLGIVALVLRLDEIREQLDALRQQVA
ncbi:hypothetical protein CCC_00531 [Paramagnetospirillum magnetotacticum MS-1]|uniref:Uncharacterized protein n=1 Tax=Paramagnetospirillum magnetotacticum MS-1 TaxID=272627 RepID=A0A0C2YRY9_PARME|nr:hypothetical protein [Paramagnetospirillum magnetotacticum]KIL97470.1 hypothetical protein CCC_00531 [Paramagnetospirillum magnetotacticum MS-1]